MVQFLKKRWVYHCLIWLTTYLFFVGISFWGDNKPVSYYTLFKEPFFFFLPIIPITYLSFWAKDLFFTKRRYFSYAIVVVLIVIAGVLLYEFIDSLDGEMGNPRSQNIINFIFLQLFVQGLQYFKRGIINQYQLQELKAKTAVTELNALKSQLNPHFLFNTLNNIYGINQINSEKGSEMIMELSDVMRYHLELSKEGQVRLEDEIQLLVSYITLEKLRLRDTCDVQVDFEDINKSLMISPLLFIPFVENAFKHGTHPTRDCFVHISLKTVENRIFLTVKNSVIANRKIVKTNIGLHNTKRRLDLIYPEKHELKISRTDIEYLVELIIEL